MTLYMKLGGRKAIAQAMPKLRMRLEQDPCFEPSEFREEFEASSDLSEFLVFLCGGAPIYDGKPVNELLSPLLTCTDMYERFVDHLVVIFLGETSGPDEETDLREMMSRLRPLVLDPKPAAPIKVYSVDTDIMRV